MNKMVRKSLLAAGVSLGLGFASGVTFAEECDPKTDPKCEPPPPPSPKSLCHNIGGPMELGANCDGATGTCTFTYMQADGTTQTMTVPENHFLGILIGKDGGGPQSEGAIAAHLAHGDGEVIMTFIPALHLASTGQIHQASNVECLAERAITTQPPEPGN